MLTIRRPTLTTVRYTVSTRPQNRTIAAWIISYLSVLLRISLGTLVAVFLLKEYENTASSSPTPDTHGLLPRLGGLALETALSLHQVFLYWSANLSWIWRTAIYVAVTWVILQRSYTEESLLVMRGLGVQTSTSSPNYLWTNSTRFIPQSSIQDIFIHEAFKGFELRFYLAIVIEDEGEVVVVFPSIMPRREILEKVWRGAKACLYEPKG